MAYIDTKYLFQCETCRHHLSGKCDTWCDHGEEYIPLMTKIPTADVVEVKHGEWYLLDECSNEGVYCSVCHKKVYKKDYANQKLKSPRCPNCGAYMDGGKARMTCKDCICRAMCYKHEHYGYGDEYDEKPCEMFKNKADFVEVVRCKGCENKAGEINQCGDVYCSLHQGWFDKDAFCSYGERKDGKDTNVPTK